MKATIILFSALVSIIIWQLVRHYPDFFRLKKFKNSLGVVGILAGVVLVFFGLQFWVGQSPYFESVVTIFVLLLGLPVTIYFGKDLLRGLQLRIAGKLTIGKSIQADKFEGQVLYTGLFNVKLSDGSGKQFSLPYSSLSFVSAPAPRSLKAEVMAERLTIINLEVPSIDEKKLRREIIQVILNSPWVKLGPFPNISMELVENDNFRITITVSLLADKYKQRFEDFIRKAFT